MTERPPPRGPRELSVPGPTVGAVDVDRPLSKPPDISTAKDQDEVRRLMVAHVEWELAQAELVRAKRAQQLPSRGRRRVPGCSVVFSMRLDPGELEALETRALLEGIKPSVLARSFVRRCLATAAADDGLAAALERMEEAVLDLREQTC